MKFQAESELRVAGVAKLDLDCCSPTMDFHLQAYRCSNAVHLDAQVCSCI